MSQITTGVHRILSSPTVYSLFQRALGSERCRKAIFERHVQPPPNATLLDLGCGPGNNFDYFQDYDYTGIDLSETYINAAKKKFPHAGTFLCEDILNYQPENDKKYDIVMAFGLLHHLDDHVVEKLAGVAKNVLKPGGYLITCDNCYVPSQSKIAKFLIDNDRGQNVRTPEDYASLLQKSFADIGTNVYHDLLRIPYTHVILECRNNAFANDSAIRQ